MFTMKQANRIPSLLMVAGRQHYKLHRFIDEAENYGVSKRISVQSIPEGLDQALSKIFIAHPRAIVKVTAEGKTLADLAYRLLEMGMLTQVQWAKLVDLELPYWAGEELRPFDPVPECMLDITYALSQVEDDEHRELVKEFSLEFCLGIIGWSPFQGFQLVLPHGKSELPPDLEEAIGHHVASGYLEPVHVVYTTEGGQEEDEAEEDGGLL